MTGHQHESRVRNPSSARQMASWTHINNASPIAVWCIVETDERWRSSALNGWIYDMSLPMRHLVEKKRGKKATNKYTFIPFVCLFWLFVCLFLNHLPMKNWQYNYPATFPNSHKSWKSSGCQQKRFWDRDPVQWCDEWQLIWRAKLYHWLVAADKLAGGSAKWRQESTGSW